jgi:hypothetical protein
MLGIRNFNFIKKYVLKYVVDLFMLFVAELPFLCSYIIMLYYIQIINLIKNKKIKYIYIIKNSNHEFKYSINYNKIKFQNFNVIG